MRLPICSLASRLGDAHWLSSIRQSPRHSLAGLRQVERKIKLMENLDILRALDEPESDEENQIYLKDLL
jgi:hypothetical protein